MKKLLLNILTIAILCSSATFALAAETENIITVGINAEYMPFEYYENGELKGFDIELMNLIGKKIGKKIEFEDMAFDALFHAVLSGKVDCAISAITVTEERDSMIDYSREYLKTNSVTFENGQINRKSGEDYAIIFRSGVSQAKDKSSELTDYETLYISIDNALKELSQDGTVGKLIEKYELNKPLDETKENIEYEAVCGCAAPAAETSATSVPSSRWAADSIEIAKEINVIKSGGNYNFPGAITREEFCEFIFNYIENIAEISVEENNKMPFEDTTNSHISVLNSMGIINGKSETEFAPNDFLTREEAATILCRLIQKIYPDSAATERYFAFDDSKQISDWAMSGIQTICNMGIMEGTDDNNFAPQDLYTTEQAVATLVRVYKNAGNIVGKQFMIDSLTWGEKWENIKERGIFSQANVVADDENRFAVKLSNAEFLGVKGDMVLQFSVSDKAFPFSGFVTAYFAYNEEDEKELLSNGEKIYGERKKYFLDKNGLENPLNPAAWYSAENMDNSLSAAERERFATILKDVEETRADAIMRGPLVVVSVNESDNVVTIDGDNAASIFNLRYN